MLLLNLVVALGAIWLTIKLSKAIAKRRRLTSKFDELPGATPFPFHPIFDTISLMFINEISIKRTQIDSFVYLYDFALAQCKVFENAGLFRWYLGFKPVVFMFSPENIEAIMQSTTVLDKADEYRMFEPWIGEGLVTSKRTKWQIRRKLLTPAFHFRILNDFVPVMNEEATKLIRKLNNVKYSRSFDVAPVVALCTLDTICETAMGVNINCQANEHCDYVRAMYEVGETSLARVCRPWLWPDFVFHRTKLGQRFAIANKCMHDFTRRVILDRKQEWERMLEASATEKVDSTATSNGFGNSISNGNGHANGNISSNGNGVVASNGTGSVATKVTFDDLMTSSSFKNATKRLAFLDLLMHQHLIENNMSLEDIREEVDTFMFAGHDTTAMTISWSLYLLGLNEHHNIQERVRREVDDIIGGGQDLDEFESVDQFDASVNLNERLKLADISVDQLTKMKYLDMVVKETLRLYPSIPFIGRQMTEDVLVGGKHLIPEGSTCVIFTHALHQNAQVFSKPEVFDPDRFLPENVAKRHAFSFIPFSAGARNCIGQKFAKMEVKIILAKIIRNYYIQTTIERDKLKLVGELVLRSTEGLHIKLTPRFKA